MIMASTIVQIKQQVNQIGQQATQTAGQLAQLASNFDTNIAVVNSAIGGVTSGEDKTMIASLQQASQAVKNASASLIAAANAAKNWAAKV